MIKFSAISKRACARVTVVFCSLLSGAISASAGGIECYAFTKSKAFLINMDGQESRTLSIPKGLNIKIVDYNPRTRLASVYRFGEVRISNLSAFSADCDRLGIR